MLWAERVMKLNWINVLATILILGGVFLLVQKRMAKNALIPAPGASTTQPRPTTSISVDQAKVFLIKQLEVQLGRPLTDAEKEMVVPSAGNGSSVKMEIHEPLRS